MLIKKVLTGLLIGSFLITSLAFAGQTPLTSKNASTKISTQSQQNDVSYKIQDGYVYVFWGQKPTAGYQIKIVNATLNNNTLYVYFCKQSPKPGNMVAQVITYPKDKFKLPTSNKPIKEVKLIDVTTLEQTYQEIVKVSQNYEKTLNEVKMILNKLRTEKDYEKLNDKILFINEKITPIQTKMEQLIQKMKADKNYAVYKSKVEQIACDLKTKTNDVANQLSKILQSLQKQTKQKGEEIENLLN